MDLTNYKGKTSLLGFSIPNLVIYGLIAGILYMMYKTFTSITDRIKKFFGMSSDTDEAISDNNEALLKTIKSNSAVQGQMNNQSRILAENIWTAINAYGYDQHAVFAAFRAIKNGGANQMAAVFQIFGSREISLFPFGSKKGNLIELVKWRLTSEEYNRNLGTNTVRWSVRTLLNWIGTIK